MKNQVIIILLTLSVIVQAQTRPDFVFSDISDNFMRAVIDNSNNIHAVYRFGNGQDTVWIYYQEYDSMGYIVGDPIKIPESGPNSPLSPELAVHDSLIIITWRDIFINLNSAIYAKFLIYNKFGSFSRINYKYYMDTERYSPQPLFLGDSLTAICWTNIGSPFDGARASTFDTSFNFFNLDMPLTQDSGDIINVSNTKFFFQEKFNRLLVIWGDNRGARKRFYCRFLTTQGELIGEEFLVSDSLDFEDASTLEADMDNQGKFVVSWCAQVDNEWHTYWRYFNADLSYRGPITRIEGLPGHVLSYSSSDIALSDSGDIIVVWEHIIPEGYVKIYGQRYRKHAIAFGYAFKVSTETESENQYWPQVIINNDLIFTHWVQTDGNRVANFLDFNDPYLNIDVNEENISQSFKLLQNYPNPFNPSTTIEYRLSISAHISLAIYNALGQKVRDLYRGIRTAGNHKTQWDGRDDQGKALSSGIYFYHMRYGSNTQTRKMLLLR